MGKAPVKPRKQLLSHPFAVSLDADWHRFGQIKIRLHPFKSVPIRARWRDSCAIVALLVE